MYDPTFEHPQAELLHELYQIRIENRARGGDWPLDVERAYGQALIGKELYVPDLNSQISYLLESEDAFTFNAMLYHMFVVAQWPDHLFPLYIEAARQYRKQLEKVDKYPATDYESWKLRNAMKDELGAMEHAAWDIFWDHRIEPTAPETEAGEPRQLDMFSESEGV